MLAKWMLTMICSAAMALSTLLCAQQEVAQASFQRVWNETEQAMVLDAAADYYTRILASSGEQIPVFRADLDSLSYYLLQTHDAMGRVAFAAAKAGRGEFKSLGEAPLSSAENQISGEILPLRSVLLLPDGPPILVLNRKLNIHSFELETATFFSLAQDTLSYLGQVVTRQRENDEMMQVYDGDGLVRKLRFLPGENGVVLLQAEVSENHFVSFNASELSYSEEYRLGGPAGLALLSITGGQAGAVSESRAEAILGALLNHYQSTRWNDEHRNTVRVQQRAHYFMSGFTTLTRLRPDYAPAFYHLARMQTVLGDDARAREQLITAFRLDETLYETAVREQDFQALGKIPVPVTATAYSEKSSETD